MNMSVQSTQQQTSGEPVNVAETLTEEQTARRDAFVGRIFGSVLGGLEMLTIYLGKRLGLYQALWEHGDATSKELATRTNTSERYIREWLEQQAAAAILTVDDAGAGTLDRRYELPAEHAEVLLGETSLNYMTPLADLIYGLTTQVPAVADAFEHGGGVPWSDYGDLAREGQAALNRPVFDQLLGQVWLPSIADVHTRLQADPPARVADIACGYGWSSVRSARHRRTEWTGRPPDIHDTRRG